MNKNNAKLSKTKYDLKKCSYLLSFFQSILLVPQDPQPVFPTLPAADPPVRPHPTRGPTGWL